MRLQKARRIHVQREIDRESITFIADLTLIQKQKDTQKKTVQVESQHAFALFVIRALRHLKVHCVEQARGLPTVLHDDRIHEACRKLANGSATMISTSASNCQVVDFLSGHSRDVLDDLFFEVCLLKHYPHDVCILYA